LLDHSLIEAYRATDYRVHGDTPFTLRIEQTCTACDAVLDAYGATNAAYLTAWNPFSQPNTDVMNASAQEKLAADLSAISLAVIRGEGVGQIGDWPPEQSLFALGINRDKALGLAKQYGQNAFVWIERGQPAELVLCSA